MEIYNEIQEVKKLEHLWAEENPRTFGQLTDEQKNTLEKYYLSIYRNHDRRLMIMAREASVQLTYQNALLLYEFFYPPLLELDFTHSPIFSIFGQDIKINSPSARWIAGLIFQIVSMMLSAKSTFSPINDSMTLSGFKNNKMMGLIHYIGQMLHVILHLLFATGVVYLLKVNKYMWYHYIG